jgi:hypothetical protein
MNERCGKVEPFKDKREGAIQLAGTKLLPITAAGQVSLNCLVIFARAL